MSEGWRIFYRLQNATGAGLIDCVTVGLVGGETAHLVGALVGVTIYSCFANDAKGKQ